MDILLEDHTILFQNIKNFNLTHTLLSGQAFRFTEEKGTDEETVFTGFVQDHYVKVIQKGNTLTLHSDYPDPAFWTVYFNLDVAYEGILEEITQDSFVKEAVDYAGKGIRILKQDPFETVMTFLCAQNTNIPNIIRMIQNLCCTYGEKKTYQNVTYSAFPSAEALAHADLLTLRDCKLGYRAPYVLRSAQMIHKGEIDLSHIESLPFFKAKEEIQKLPGIGPKVADCILLFSMKKYEALPTDTWIKKVLSENYSISAKNEKALCLQGQKLFGSYAGYAQQYLFHYARTTGKIQKGDRFENR